MFSIIFVNATNLSMCYTLACVICLFTQKKQTLLKKRIEMWERQQPNKCVLIWHKPDNTVTVFLYNVNIVADNLPSQAKMFS